jgi:hypothetical protein
MLIPAISDTSSKQKPNADGGTLHDGLFSAAGCHCHRAHRNLHNTRIDPLERRALLAICRLNPGTPGGALTGGELMSHDDDLVLQSCPKPKQSGGNANTRLITAFMLLDSLRL